MTQWTFSRWHHTHDEEATHAVLASTGVVAASSTIISSTTILTAVAATVVVGSSLAIAAGAGAFQNDVAPPPLPPMSPPPPSTPSHNLVACEAVHSFPTDSLQKNRNPAFQQVAWNFGCRYADVHTTTVVGCENISDLGCCSTSDCHSNGCGGGGCCIAAGSIGSIACAAYHQMHPPPPSPPSTGKGGGNTGGGASGSISCPTGSDYVGSSALAGTAAALLGSVACVDSAAVAYRGTLGVNVAGVDTTTVNMYGPFENGFTSSVPNMACLGDNVVDGGVDTYTATFMVQHLCNDDSLSILGTCGDHAQPKHFHEYLTQCLSQQDPSSGHSTRIGTAGDGLGVYGPYGDGGTTPTLDACGATQGVTPDSGGAVVNYYVAQSAPPFFIGCYTNSDATTTLGECEAMYDGCSSTGVTITTAYGSGVYREWCPCWNSYGSNAGEDVRPAFWPP